MAERARTEAGAPADPADVGLIVLNHNGRRYLPACLEAALALDGLAGPEAVIVADNGSTDGSSALVRRDYPGVSVLEWPENLGFAAGNNRAVAAVEARWVLLLNNDTRIAPDTLLRLVEATAEGAACVGARLVSWDGQRLDFDGGGAAWTGHGHPLGHGRRVPRRPEPPRPTLLASGAALLVRRDVFLALGGFDPSYFAYYEDVDLGWRLWLAGHTVRHVPAAVVRHRGGGTASAVSARAARLYERNALATVIKVYDDVHLRRVLPAALALAAHRAGADRHVIAAAVPATDVWPPLPDDDWPGWPALAPLGLDLDALWATRQAVQATRRRPDAAILPRLEQPQAPVPPTAEGRAALREAVQRFGLASVFGPVPAAGRWERLRRRVLPRGLGAAVASRRWQPIARLGAVVKRVRRGAEVLWAGGPGLLLNAARRQLDRWRGAGGE